MSCGGWSVPGIPQGCGDLQPYLHCSQTFIGKERATTGSERAKERPSIWGREAEESQVLVLACYSHGGPKGLGPKLNSGCSSLWIQTPQETGEDCLNPAGTVPCPVSSHILEGHAAGQPPFPAPPNTMDLHSVSIAY